MNSACLRSFLNLLFRMYPRQKPVEMSHFHRRSVHNEKNTLISYLISKLLIFCVYFDHYSLLTSLSGGLPFVYIATEILSVKIVRDDIGIFQIAILV